MKNITIILVAILLVLALLLGACSSATTTTTTSAPTTSAKPTSSTTAATTTATTSKPATTTATTTASTTAKPTTTAPTKGGTLRIGVLAEANLLGVPWELTLTHASFQSRPALETLFIVDEKGDPQPWLLESYKADSAAKTYTFKIREGIKFHDGTPFNASACKWNLDQWMAAPLGKRVLPSLQSVDLLDDFTVRLNLSTWDSLVPILLRGGGGNMISPTSFMEKGIDWARNNPVGTGPFKLQSWDRDVKKVYVRNDNYWQAGKPYLDKIEYIVIKDPTVQMMSFLANEVDIIHDVNPKNVLDLKAKGYAYRQTSQYGYHYGIVPGSSDTTSPMNKLAVRQATQHAINTQLLADKICYGLAYPVNQLANPTNWGWNKNVKGNPYNPAKAKELLAAAGFSTGFDTSLIVSNAQLSLDLYTAVQTQLAEVGIRAKLDVREYQGWFQVLAVEGAAGKMFEVGFSSSADPTGQYGMALITTANPDGANKNTLRYKDVDATYVKVKSALTLEDRNAAMMELQRLTFDEYVMYHPMVNLPRLAVANAKVHDDMICVIDATFWHSENAWLSK